MNKIKCPNCGVYNSKESNTCVECGADLNVSKNQSVPSTQVNARLFMHSLAVPMMSLAICVLVGIICFAAGKSSSSAETIKQTDSHYNAESSALSELSVYKASKSALTSQLSSQQAQTNSLSAQISSQQAVLSILQKDVTSALGTPKKLPAGQFAVGNDIPAGKYSITGTSNLVVYSASGGASKINTILGNGSDGISVSQYVCTLNAGDIIKAEGADTYTPIG